MINKTLQDFTESGIQAEMARLSVERNAKIDALRGLSMPPFSAEDYLVLRKVIEESYAPALDELLALLTAAMWYAEQSPHRETPLDELARANLVMLAAQANDNGIPF